MTRPLSAQALEWNRSHADLWAARAVQLRAEGSLGRAMGLESVVRGMRTAIAATPTPAMLASDPTNEIEQLEARLAVWQPSLYPGTNIMTAVGPFCDGIRHDLGRRIAALKGEALPAEPVAIPPPLILPPAEAVPFTAGPQLSLFEMAA